MEPDEGEGESHLGATEALLLLKAELRKQAESYARREAPGVVEPTSLIHEVYLRFKKRRGFSWDSREHFIADAAREMRRILVARARERRAEKRGQGWRRVTLHEGMLTTPEREIDLLDLEEALQQLESLEPRQSRIVEMRFFGGLTLEEVAPVLGVTVRTVTGDWAMARAWLQKKLRDGGGGRDE